MSDPRPGVPERRTDVGARPAPSRPSEGSRPPARSLSHWLDQRTGYSAWVSLVVDQPISGGARWWYVFGAILLFLLGTEFVTGALLAAYYAPSATTAWTSTVFIQDTLTLGWFIRGLHSFGSSGLLIVSFIHLFQVLIFGAYRAPREMNWWVGLAIFGLLFAFALTGYGLPWDESGFWAKQIELRIVGTVPLIGPTLQVLLQGGRSLGHYTLTHLFALHALVLPAVVGFLVLGHIALVRRHGVTPRWSQDETKLAQLTQSYWPHQAIRDASACAVVFVLLSLLVIRTQGARLDGPADPQAIFQARPEWYSLPLFELRAAFEGALELVATVVIPAIFALFLAALPWLDRARGRSPSQRLPILFGAVCGFVGLGVLGYLPYRRDQNDAAYQHFRAEVNQRSTLARRLARQGVPPEGGLAVYRNDREFRTRDLWTEQCGQCHSFTGHGGTEGPDLKDYNSRAWIERFLRNPDDPLHMGGAKFQKGMRPVEGTADEFKGLTEWLYAETGATDVDTALIERSLPLFSEKDCDSCHERDGVSADNGPNLKARGTLPYLVDFISDPADDRFFGRRNKMPRFAGKLTPDQIGDLALFVLSESKK